MKEKNGTSSIREWVILYESIVDKISNTEWKVKYYGRGDVEKAKPMVPTMSVKPHSMN